MRGGPARWHDSRLPSWGDVLGRMPRGRAVPHASDGADVCLPTGLGMPSRELRADAMPHRKLVGRHGPQEHRAVHRLPARSRLWGGKHRRSPLQRRHVCKCARLCSLSQMRGRLVSAEHGHDGLRGLHGRLVLPSRCGCSSAMRRRHVRQRDRPHQLAAMLAVPSGAFLPNRQRSSR